MAERLVRVIDDLGEMTGVLRADQLPPGLLGTPAAYIHHQPFAATTWTIVHNLGRHPAAISVIDSGGNVWITKVIHLDVNTSQAVFAFPFAGEATVL
jgi:hypothetical protein